MVVAVVMVVVVGGRGTPVDVENSFERRGRLLMTVSKCGAVSGAGVGSSVLGWRGKDGETLNKQQTHSQSMMESYSQTSLVVSNVNAPHGNYAAFLLRIGLCTHKKVNEMT